MKKLYESHEMMDLLSECNYDVIEVVRALRKLIFSMYPDTEEKVYLGWRGIGYTDKTAGYFTGIFPEKDYVKLGFEHGDKIIDKYKVFDRTSGQRVKYIKIKNPNELDENILKYYLKMAGDIRK